MAARAHHCPFLNRDDNRCSENFSLDHLGAAFSRCFGSYSACAVYSELLAERQVRRSRAASVGQLANPGYWAQWVEDMEAQPSPDSPEKSHAQEPLVQLTCRGRVAQHAA
jgi:hypothetical protein